MIVRYEPWGAWVKLDAALVAIDREGIRAMGLADPLPSAWTRPPRPSRPIEVHVAVTGRCAAGCEGCYLDARPDGLEPSREALLASFDALARAGVFTVAFGGGEPTLRDDLGSLAEEARARGLTPVVTTSGIGLGPKKLTQLEAFAQVNVSYDGAADAYAAVRGFDASAAAEAAIVALSARGVNVGVNVVLTRDTFDRTEETLQRARSLGAREAQLLRYKPAGRANTLDYMAKRLRPEQAEALGALLRRLVWPDFHVRIDCALVPFLSLDPIADDPEQLARWGVFGCEAGHALAATRADGRLAPCSFAPATDAKAEDVAGRKWLTDPTLAAFRSFPRPEPCASCNLRSICRGGCKIVSGDPMRADPECPRVMRASR
jgi:radical SAM protein with 4Fe4S-binding SPASM domain